MQFKKFYNLPNYIQNYLLREDINISKTKILNNYPERGYQVRDEIWTMPQCPDTPIKAAYSLKDNSYIGDPKVAERIHNKYGVTEFYKNPINDGTVSCYGYSPHNKKWYGWSHRAIYGFTIGDTIKKGDILDNVLPIGFTAENEADCKNMAMLFAKEVS